MYTLLVYKRLILLYVYECKKLCLWSNASMEIEAKANTRSRFYLIVVLVGKQNLNELLLGLTNFEH